MALRKDLRDQVVAALTTDPGVLALAPVPPIESGRRLALDNAALPTVLVYLRGERADGRITISPREDRILSDLVVEYVDLMPSSGAPPEDALDEIADVLRLALVGLETSRFGGLVRQAVYQGTDLVVDPGAGRSACSVVLTFQLEYGRTVEPVLDDEFDTAEVEYSTGDASPDNFRDSLDLIEPE